jgi:hypothetical protein
MEYKFPCYDCKDIGEETPRCQNWKKCNNYGCWLKSEGVKGFAICVAGIIVEKRKKKEKYSMFSVMKEVLNVWINFKK